MNAQSNLPPAARRQVREAARQQAAAQAAAQAAPAAVAPNGQAPAQPNLAPPPNLPNVGVDFSPGPQWVPASPGNAAPPQVAAPGSQGQPAPAAPAAGPSNGPSGAAVAPAQPPAEDFAHKYRVLEGKYRAEVGRSVDTIRAQQMLIDNLQAQLQRAPVQQTPAQPATIQQRAQALGITPKQVEEYGPELAELVITVAENAARNAVAPVAQQMGQVAQVAGHAAQRAQVNATDAVWAALHREFGADAELINNSAEFLDWISQADVFSGQPRRLGLMQAFEAGDGTRVVQMFKAFKNEEDASRAPTARIPQVDPATLVAPGQGRVESAAAPGSAAGRIWSEQDVRDFYARVQRGRMNPQEKAQIEAELHAAMREGRIRPDRSNAHLSNAPY